GPARGAGARPGAGSAADALRRAADRPGPDRDRRDHGPDLAPQPDAWPDQHRGHPPRTRELGGCRPGAGAGQRPDRVLRHPGGAAGEPRSAGAPVPGGPAGRADRVRRHAAREGRLMAFADATRSLGRAGMFSLSVLRASKPTADFFAELVREIYKIGGRSLPIIAVGGAFVGLSLTLLAFRGLERFGATNQVSILVGLGLCRELAPVLTALLFVGGAGAAIAAELGLMRASDQITALGLMAIGPVAKP